MEPLCALSPLPNGAPCTPPPAAKPAGTPRRTPGLLKSGGARRVLTPAGRALFAERAREAQRNEDGAAAADAAARLLASAASHAFEVHCGRSPAPAPAAAAASRLCTGVGATELQGMASDMPSADGAEAQLDFGAGWSPTAPSDASSSPADSETAGERAVAPPSAMANPLFDDDDEAQDSDDDEVQAGSATAAAIGVLQQHAAAQSPELALPQRVPLTPSGISGTPMRVAVAEADAAPRELSFAEKEPRSAQRALAMRRASKAEAQVLGVASVLTPVRRSGRPTPSKHRRPAADIDDMLEQCDFAFAPNPHMPVPAAREEGDEGAAIEQSPAAPVAAAPAAAAAAAASEPPAAAKANVQPQKKATELATSAQPRRSSRLAGRKRN